LFEVAEGVYRIPAKAANTYLVEAPNGLVLVDTGLPGSEKRIFNAVRRIGRQPEEIKLVLLTHRHPDHIGSAAALKRETSATLASHPFEKPYVAGTLVVSMPRAWSLRGRIVKRLGAITQWTLRFLRIIKYRPIHVDKAADEDSVLEEVGLDGSIVWTPGHTKGSITLFLNRPRVAIVGDLLRGKRGKLVEPMLMESISQTHASVGRVLELEPVLICPGHGKPLPPSAVKLGKPLPVKPVVEEKKKEEDLDLESFAKDLSSGVL
jgi:glyoxylase-like metal-dependent hydrolase (beta-lactamase superfamily II)